MNALATIVLVLVGLTASLDWWSRWRHDDRLELWTKPATTVLVMLLTVACGGATLPVALTVVALLFCLVGDVALLPQVDRFVVGLAAFLVGHLVVVAAFVVVGLDSAVLSAVAVAIIGPGVVVVGRRIVRSAASTSPDLVVPVIAYLVVISAMVVVAWGTGVWAAIVGATAFIVSDSVLGWRKFVGERRWMAVVVMMTYHVALVGLALVPSTA